MVAPPPRLLQPLAHHRLQPRLRLLQHLRPARRRPLTRPPPGGAGPGAGQPAAPTGSDSAPTAPRAAGRRPAAHRALLLRLLGVQLIADWAEALLQAQEALHVLRGGLVVLRLQRGAHAVDRGGPVDDDVDPRQRAVDARLRRVQLAHLARHALRQVRRAAHAAGQAVRVRGHHLQQLRRAGPGSGDY